jgi:uncharacterized membrane protein
MTYDDTAGRARSNLEAPNQTDRILLGVCVALWLAALAAAVAAVVALVDLARPHSATVGSSPTPWLLYSVIGVSAVVIIGAIPLLIRARQGALDGGHRRPEASAPGATQNVFGPPLGTEGRQRGFGTPAIRRPTVAPATSRVGFPTAAVERVSQRYALVTASAIGAATALIGVGTYLLASSDDGLAWVGFGLAGLVTVALPVVPWYFLRQLRDVLG